MVGAAKHQCLDAGISFTAQHMQHACALRLLHDCVILTVITHLSNLPPTHSHTAEGLAYIHDMNVLHCDFCVGNLLVASDLSIKLCDFQGRLLNRNGDISLNGGAAESVMSSMPRPDRNHCDRKTDIFAFGTALYFIMTGHSPFPNLDTIDDEDEIRRQYEQCEFPCIAPYQGGEVIYKCWKGGYQSAADIMSNLIALEERKSSISIPC
ncbi:unnamed protein product [Periconia digitata]|uniref:EKC/KEOPS complex subunit BUD32 n=1 Tax=Periconia digitata TaxID=1303443 RepID=A0A9W4UG42_9PLEO|nr:unnamed protein product [Periconia digitata]